MKRDRRHEERNIGELDQLVVKDDDIMRRNDRWNVCQSTLIRAWSNERNVPSSNALCL